MVSRTITHLLGVSLRSSERKKKPAKSSPCSIRDSSFRTSHGWSGQSLSPPLRKLQLVCSVAHRSSLSSPRPSFSSSCSSSNSSATGPGLKQDTLTVTVSAPCARLSCPRSGSCSDRRGASQVLTACSERKQRLGAEGSEAPRGFLRVNLAASDWAGFVKDGKMHLKLQMSEGDVLSEVSFTLFSCKCILRERRL